MAAKKSKVARSKQVPVPAGFPIVLSTALGSVLSMIVTALTSGSVLFVCRETNFLNTGIPIKKKPSGRSPDGSFPRHRAYLANSTGTEAGAALESAELPVHSSVKDLDRPRRRKRGHFDSQICCSSPNVREQHRPSYHYRGDDALPFASQAKAEETVASTRADRLDWGLQLIVRRPFCPAISW